MPTEKQPITYDDIEETPASTLMALSFAELNGFIREAERRFRKAQTLKDWLVWIKTEKALRYKPAGSTDGGAS